MSGPKVHKSETDTQYSMELFPAEQPALFEEVNGGDEFGSRAANGKRNTHVQTWNVIPIGSCVALEVRAAKKPGESGRDRAVGDN